MEDEKTKDNEERYSGSLVIDYGGKRYIRKRPGSGSVGLIKSYWAKFITDLEVHINYEYNRDIDPLGECDPDEYTDDEYAEKQCEINDEQDKLIVALSSNGTARSISDSQKPSSSDRVKGSKHGAGLALDIKINTTGPDAEKMFKDSGLNSEKFKYGTHNPILSKNKKLSSVIRSYTNSIPEIRWGGDFTGDRAVIEFHHFEIIDSMMPKYFDVHEDELSKLGVKKNSLTSLDSLSRLYTKIAESEDKEYSLLREFIIETIR
jgi:hypothetical protein